MTIICKSTLSKQDLLALHDGIMTILGLVHDDKTELKAVNNGKNSTVADLLFLTEIAERFHDILPITHYDDIVHVSYSVYEEVTFYVVSYFASRYDSFHSYAFIADIADDVKAVEVKLKFF